VWRGRSQHRGYTGVRTGRRCHGNRDGESDDHGQLLIGVSVAQGNTRRDCDGGPSRTREGRQNEARRAYKSVLKVGDIEAKLQEQRTIPSWVGGALLDVGCVLVIAGLKKSS
jgi:hypothetical protein